MFVIFIRNRIIINIDRKAPHVIIEANENISIIDLIYKVCSKNSLNLKNVDIVSIGDGKTVAKAYFPYHINPLLLDYFVMEIRKEEGIINADIRSNNSNSGHDTPHES